MTRPTPWNDQENAALVALYFTMLDAATSGQKYNKAAMIRDSQQHESDDGGPSYPGPLVNRSRGSIEAKLMNASAAHHDIDANAPTMAGYGYKAWGNYQCSLKNEMAEIIESRDERPENDNPAVHSA